jgi:hypothetical protein
LNKDKVIVKSFCEDWLAGGDAENHAIPAAKPEEQFDFGGRAKVAKAETLNAA